MPPIEIDMPEMEVIAEIRLKMIKLKDGADGFLLENPDNLSHEKVLDLIDTCLVFLEDFDIDDANATPEQGKN